MTENLTLMGKYHSIKHKSALEGLAWKELIQKKIDELAGDEEVRGLWQANFIRSDGAWSMSQGVEANSWRVLSSGRGWPLCSRKDYTQAGWPDGAQMTSPWRMWRDRKNTLSRKIRINTAPRRRKKSVCCSALEFRSGPLLADPSRAQNRTFLENESKTGVNIYIWHCAKDSSSS